MIHVSKGAVGVHKVLVICGSVRPTRICHDVARWVMEALPAGLALELELVDLANWPLPMDDEPGIPARDTYAHAHTQAWSRKVSEAAGFVFVTPQYNWGYPAPLKNALDHLYKEWARKPAIVVTYGFHGGGKCAAQLRQVLKGLRMRPVRTMPALTLPEALKKEAHIDVVLGAFRPAKASVERAFAQLISKLPSDGEASRGKTWRWWNRRWRN